MIDLSEEMSKNLRRAQCPYCPHRSGSLLEGPHGGLCVNVKCSECEREFNITIVGPCHLLKGPELDTAHD